jgi:CHAT domain-containing protein
LRDETIGRGFKVPEWFYTPKEVELNKKYKELLIDAANQYKKLGRTRFINGKDIQELTADKGNRFVEFLVDGELDSASLKRLTKPEGVKIIQDEVQFLIKELPKTAALLQYVLYKDYLYISFNSADRKIFKKIQITKNNLINKIYLFRIALSAKQDSTPVAKELYDLLIKPVEQELIDEKITQVMLSLDGSLRYLPFAALFDGKNYLVTKYDFSIYDNLNVQHLFKKTDNSWRVAGFGVTKSINDFVALPSVSDELNSIVKNPRGGVYPGKISLDKSFTLNELKSSIKQKYPVLHLATHFKFSPGTELNSYLQLGDGTRLTLAEFKKINLQGVDLVAFSACQTGMGGGMDEEGNEIAGLSYISQKNGAKTVIASLWSVSDKSTALLMSKMYSYLRKGYGKAESLRRAQLDLLNSKKYSNPFYWAPFEVFGGWQ